MTGYKCIFLFLMGILAFTGTVFAQEEDPSTGPVSMVVPRNWNTFIGGAQGDGVSGVITDSNGNIYVGGYSAGTWGNPIRAFTTNSQDGFIAKFNPRGELLWNTFIGENAINLVSGLYINNSGTIYVVGSSNGSWGAPVTANAGGADAFIARFNADGALLWNTFMGGTGTEGGSDITVDSSGAMVITGSSNASWGSPVRPFTPSTSDAFAAKLNAVGTVLWHTFLGGPHIDSGYGVTVDGNGNVFVGGRSVDNWGAPLNPQAGNGAWDAFAARLDSNGNLVWNTFIGEPHYMYGCIGDRSGNIYMTGQCYATFGNPIRPYLNGDIHVVKINPNGGLAWNTFLGSSATGDQGHGLALDGGGNVYVSARVEATWGMPRQPYTGGRDCMVAKLSTTGHLQWHTFMGSATDDEYPKVAVSPNGSVYVAGQSDATWGAPIRLFDAATDVFLASFDQYPEVSGYVLDPDGHPVGGVEILFTGDSDPEITNPAGRFSNTVDFGWAGTITPRKDSYIFEPETRHLSNVSSDRGGQDFVAQKLTIFHISGTITLPGGTPLSGVALTVSGLDQPVVTGANGTFDIELPEGWAGSITPSCPMYGFVPASFEYPSLAESKTGQNFQASPMLTLSGERRTEKAWIITKSYCRVSVTMDKTEPLAHEFVLLKKTGSSEFQTVQTFTPSDLSGSTRTYLDLEVEADQTVTYRVMVKDAAGTVIYRSPAITP